MVPNYHIIGMLDFVHQIVSDWKAHTSSTQELDGGKAWACTMVYTLALVA